MGYQVSAHIVREKPNVSRLSELPASIGWRLYQHKATKIYAFDAFRSSRPPRYPFQTYLPTGDIHLDLPEELRSLEKIYAFLDKSKLSNSFKKSYVNFALLMNQLVGSPVLSLIADDEEVDFAVTAAEGSVRRLKCLCHDLVVSYEGGNAPHIQPLVPESDEDSEFLTNLDKLKSQLPDAVVADRNIPHDSQLHRIAMEEWRRFTNCDPAILGLGSFDPPEFEDGWTLLGHS